MKDPDATITLTAAYTLTDEAYKKLCDEGCNISQIRYVDVRIIAREALRTGYISDDPNRDEYVLCPTEAVLEDSRTDLDKVDVLRGTLPVFDHIIYEYEATELLSKQIKRHDEVLALAREKQKIPEGPSVLLIGRYLLTKDALRTARVLKPDTLQKQTVLISVDAKEALRTGYINEKNEYDDFVLCDLRPDLTTGVGVFRERRIPKFDDILSEEEATKIVTNNIARYDEVLAVSVTAWTPTEEQAASPDKKRPSVALCGKYRLTHDSYSTISVNNPCVIMIQNILFKVDAEEAARTGYASNARSPDGSILYGQFNWGDEDLTFSELEPDLDRVGVIRKDPLRVLDHILTATEAAAIVTNEMKRYDEVLGVSQKIQELKDKNQSTTVVLVGKYFLTKEAHENLALSGIKTARQQRVPVVLDAREAIRTKYARIDENGCIVSLDSEQALLQRIEPNELYSDTIRYEQIKEFDHVLTVEEATKIVTDEMARFDEVLADSKAKAEICARKIEEIKAKEKAEKQILDESRQKSKNAFLAELNCYMPRIVAGEPCVIDSNEHGTPVWFKIDGKGIDVRYDLLDNQECEAVKKTLLGEWRKRADAEITAWIQVHGSPRLRKAVEVGLLSQIRGAYRSERLAIDLPGWVFLSEEQQRHIKVRLNPPESAIDAFREAILKWPEGNARLSSIRILQKPPAFEDWAPFLVMKCPFHNALIGLLLNDRADAIEETDL
jgi:hypothetical protein